LIDRDRVHYFSAGAERIETSVSGMACDDAGIEGEHLSDFLRRHKGEGEALR
jgi:hypothetical protein